MSHFWQEQRSMMQDLPKYLFKRERATSTPYESLAQIPPLNTINELSEESINQQLRLTLWHVTRDLLMPIRLSSKPEATLAEEDLYRFLSGKSVYTYACKELQELLLSLQDIVVNYFMEEKSSYIRINMDGVEMLTTGEPQGVQGDWHYSMILADGKMKKFPVTHAVVIRGLGSMALKQELRSLFALRQQLFKGISHATAYSHKVVVQVEGLTALMAEASSDSRLMERLKSELNQQVSSLFSSPNDLALVDSRTKIGSFHLEVGQLEAINDYIYSELARMLQVPKTKLLGQSAGGLNATGLYDYQHYQDYLESIRQDLIYPFLESMEIPYCLDYRQNLPEIKETLELLAFSEQHLPFLGEEERKLLRNKLLKNLGLTAISNPSSSY